MKAIFIYLHGQCHLLSADLSPIILAFISRAVYTAAIIVVNFIQLATLNVQIASAIIKVTVHILEISAYLL